jgi:hypothetical protein
LEQVPHLPEAVRVPGLIRKERSDVVGGAQLLRRSLELVPTRGEFRANLANLMRRERCIEEALV